MHADGDDKRQYTGQQAGGLDPQPEDVERAADQIVRQRDEIRGERPERGVAQHQRQAERAQDLRQHRAFGDVPHQPEIDDDAQHEQQRRRAGDEEDRTQLQQGEGEERRIHRQHDEIAVGEVDDVHHAPDQRQAGGKQRIDRSHQQAADHHLQQDHSVELLSLFGMILTDGAAADKPQNHGLWGSPPCHARPVPRVTRAPSARVHAPATHDFRWLGCLVVGPPWARPYDHMGLRPQPRKGFQSG